MFHPCLIILSSCLGNCGVCDRGMVCIVSEFKPTDTTTIIALFLMDMVVAWHYPHDQIPGEMSRHLSSHPSPTQTKQQKQTQSICFVDGVCLRTIQTFQEYAEQISRMLQTSLKKIMFLPGKKKKCPKQHSHSMSICVDVENRAEGGSTVSGDVRIG